MCVAKCSGIHSSMDWVGTDVGPDIFCFSSRGVAELLSEEDDFTGPGKVAEKDSETCHGANSCITSGSLFDDVIASGVSDARRERETEVLSWA